jgi:hypothetical protein
VTTQLTEVDEALRLEPPDDAPARRRGLPGANGAHATAERVLEEERR